MTAEWTPMRTVEECDAIMTAPGAYLETETMLIDGRLQRVYKNQIPSVREFWLEFARNYGDREYIVFEKERYTYAQTHERASRLASVLYSDYGVRKGDRVAILMRNLPEWIMSFWGIHLLGAVPVLMNAWAPHDVLVHCIILTDPMVIITDGERASKLASHRVSERLKTERLSLQKIFIVRSHEHAKHERAKWEGMVDWSDVLERYRGSLSIWESDPVALPDENATIFFTSGTTGLPKGVLSTQRNFLCNYMNSVSGGFRYFLRIGADIPPLEMDDQKVLLLSAPLFHVIGCTAHTLTTTHVGGKIIMMRKWDKDEAVKLIVEEGCTLAGGVPTMIMDLFETSLAKGRDGSPSKLQHKLNGLAFGGAPHPETMALDISAKMREGVLPMHGYGLTECNAFAALITGEDVLARPDSTGNAPPVLDIIIVDPDTLKKLPPHKIGELWMRGPNVMKEYYRDQAATNKTITRDGWLRTGDLAYIDEEGFIYIKDRRKDIIIRGGENIHSVEVENALYADERLIDAAAVSIPDKRLGELVAAVVATKPSFHNQVTEGEVIATARKSLPAYAVPVLVLIQTEKMERNAAGKVLKDKLRPMVREEWKRRQQNSVKAKL